MEDLATENQLLRDELKESSELMRRQCEVMMQMKVEQDAERNVTRQKHEKMSLIAMRLHVMQHRDISPDNLFSHKMAAPVGQPEDIGNLKAQVCSLTRELIQLKDQHDSNLLITKQHVERINVLGQRCRECEDNLSRQRIEDDEVINMLQAKMADLETDLATQRRLAEMAILEKSQVHADFKKLINDYHDLLNRTETTSHQNLQSEIERLKVELEVAQQTLATKDTQIKELDEKVVIHAEQAKIYMMDFDAERKAREEMHSLKANLAEELEQVKDDNVQLRTRLIEQEAAKTFRCPKCQQLYADMDTLQTHMLTCID